MVKLTNYKIPAASIGKLTPLPDIMNNMYIHAGFEITDKVTKEEQTHLGKGMISTMLPYQMQDEYDRDLKDTNLVAAVVENKYLKAVFLPQYGGRLWSLYDKENDRELLYKNTVFQPGNLGLRNAWFSGGIEFNVGIKGHNPLTCSPVFCERAETSEGDILNLYEFERIRGVVYTVSAWLPEESRVLYLKCRIENLEDKEKYMYWWSNIAVPETEGTRVIVPTDDSFLCFYNENRYLLDKVSIPYDLDTDVTYPTNLPQSNDFFYKIPKDEAKWIASTERDGCGLLQCSTDELIGRKTFLWGKGQGGRTWNRWLSDRDDAYIEIQAGLAHTQLEHIPMPAKTEWSWVEAYTSLVGDPEKLHSNQWNTAVNEVRRIIDEKIGDPHKLTFPSEESITKRSIIFEGSGWGAVEEKIRGERISKYHTFPCHLDDIETKEWHTLLDSGEFPAIALNTPPASFVCGKGWVEKLAAVKESNWYCELQKGTVLYALKEYDKAEEAWKKSLEYSDNGWARRNLAMLYRSLKKSSKEAVAHILRAVELLTERGIYIDCATILNENGLYEKWLEIFGTMPEALQKDGRLKLYKTSALLRLDRLDEAREILTPEFMMYDIKEGELSISGIWFELYRKICAKETGIDDPAKADEKYPLPPRLDFRMHK